MTDPQEPPDDDGSPLTTRQEQLLEALERAAETLANDIAHHYTGPDAEHFARCQVDRELEQIVIDLVRAKREVPHA